MSSVQLLPIPVLNIYDGDKVVEVLTQTVKMIGMSIIKDRIPNFKTPMKDYLARFESNTPLLSCNLRTQNLFHKIVAGVKEQLGRNPLFNEVVALPNDAPYYLHFALQPVKELIAKLDQEQPGSVDDLIKPPKVEAPRVKRQDLEILEKAIQGEQVKGLLLISKERLNDLKLDRDDLLVFSQLSDDQASLLSRLNALIDKCENYAQ